MGGPRRTMPSRSPLPPPPVDAHADAILLFVAPSPNDTNGNGYADQVEATVHLFDRRYPLPFHEEGAFVFMLFPPAEGGNPGAEPIFTWRYEGAALAICKARSALGPCYTFAPNLLEHGSDELSIFNADLVCSFEPADGRGPVHAGSIPSLQVGRRVLVPSTKWHVTDKPADEPGSSAP